MVASASFLKKPYMLKLVMLGTMTMVYLVLVEFVFEETFARSLNETSTVMQTVG